MTTSTDPSLIVHPIQGSPATARTWNAHPDQRRERNLSLDGIRGIAVVLVLFYHHNYLNSGWLGVDLFFVLSGYLITGILRQTRDSKTFWKEFWIKRFARILPPLVLVLLLTAVLRFTLTLPQAAAYLLSGGDILAYLRPSFEPLRPLWSLAVEEHFYLLWPFAVRFMKRTHLIYLLCSLIVCEPLLRAAVTLFTHDWQFVYFLTPFRLDGLGLGCLLALAVESGRNWNVLSRWSGAGVITTAILWGLARVLLRQDFTRGHPTPIYNGLCYTLVALWAFFLIAYLLTHKKSVAARMLGWRPLVFLGTISYGLYLYQVLVRETITRGMHIDDRRALIFDAPIILLLSWLSFRFYERPMAEIGRNMITLLRTPAKSTAGR